MLVSTLFANGRAWLLLFVAFARFVSKMGSSENWSSKEPEDVKSQPATDRKEGKGPEHDGNLSGSHA